MFTGLAAKKMVNEHYCQSQQIDPKKWRVFLLGDFVNEVLRKDTMVLYPLWVVNVSILLHLLVDMSRKYKAKDYCRENRIIVIIRINLVSMKFLA